jgi:glycosyltransferase involved in cell wall biosynthesis
VASHEIVVVDDGSRDATPAILARLEGELGERLRVVRHEVNRGYGAALRDGFAASRGALVFYTDADNQFDLKELREILPLMDRNDAVLGYRVNRQDPWLRRFVSGVFNRLSSSAFGMSVEDLNCSFKLFRGPLVRGLVIESNDFFVDTEMVARIHRGGYRYVQQGVTHFPRTAGRSSVRPSDVPRTIRSLVRMRGRIPVTRPRP